MKIVIFAIVLISLSVTSKAQNENMLVGKYNLEQWMSEAKWSIEEMNKYFPNDSVINLLKPIVEEQKIGFIVFGGSWCGDTKSELPKIFSVLKSLGVDIQKIPIYGIDRDKYEPSFTSKRMMIKKVPTLIITYQNEEMFRIEEFPEKGSTWELDILKNFR